MSFKNVHFHKQMYGGSAEYGIVFMQTYSKRKIKCVFRNETCSIVSHFNTKCLTIGCNFM